MVSHGPWHAKRVGQNRDGTGIYDVYDARNQLVAAAHTAERAHVIAAAPALRETLVHAVSLIQEWHNLGMKPRQASELWGIYWRKSPEMERIRAALAQPIPDEARAVGERAL